ncbi:cadherin repeat domain-containing protein [Dokdonella sp.]|uniref:cadherin repeat domain-containing protein n=1 Tax=Dokdonella sp. TaxID=2291710 RepID=UPI002F41B5C1
MSTRSTHPRASLMAALALCLPAFSPVHAAVFCVATGAQLDDALASAATNGHDDDVRIVAGTLTGSHWPTGDVRWEYYARSSDLVAALDVSGGWNDACSSQVSTAESTVLDAQSKGPALVFHGDTINGDGLGGRISLRNLTIADASDTHLDYDGVALDYQGDFPGGGLTMERVVIVGTDVLYTGAGAGGPGRVVRVNQSATGQVKMIGNVIASNIAYVGHSSIVHVACSVDSLCSFNNNSIHDNVAGDDQVPYALSLGGTISAANNVVASNFATTIYGGVQAGPYGSRALTLRNNHFETDWFDGEYLEQATTHGSAQWTQVGVYRTPNAVSPLRDSGVGNPFGGIGSLDAAGNPRVQHGIVDRGAIEAEPVQNSGPSLDLLPQYTVPASLAVGSIVFVASFNDDGLPGPLSFSFSQTTCPGLFAIDDAGSVTLAAPVPAGLSGCALEVEVSDGEFSDLAQTTVLFDGNDVIFANGFDG